MNNLHLQTESRKLELKKRGIVDDAFSGLKHTYNIAGSFLGYSGHFDDDVLAQMRQHPDVSGFFQPETANQSSLGLSRAIGQG